MLGLDVPLAPLASFWSDQYGIRFQYLGYAAEADAMSVDGDPAHRDYSVIWTRNGLPVAALLVGRPVRCPHSAARSRKPSNRSHPNRSPTP